MTNWCAGIGAATTGSNVNALLDQRDQMLDTLINHTGVVGRA